MFQVCDDYYVDLLAKGDSQARRIRFAGGDIERLRKMTEKEWEEAKEKARRWQPTSR